MADSSREKTRARKAPKAKARARARARKAKKERAKAKVLGENSKDTVTPAGNGVTQNGTALKVEQKED